MNVNFLRWHDIRPPWNTCINICIRFRCNNARRWKLFAYGVYMFVGGSYRAFAYIQLFHIYMNFHIYINKSTNELKNCSRLYVYFTHVSQWRVFARSGKQSAKVAPKPTWAKISKVCFLVVVASLLSGSGFYKMETSRLMPLP